MGSGTSAPVPGLCWLKTPAGWPLALALGLELKIWPMGRVPASCSRVYRNVAFQCGVKFQFAKPVPALRWMAGVMKFSPGTTCVAINPGRLILICAVVHGGVAQTIEDRSCKICFVAERIVNTPGLVWTYRLRAVLV